MEQFAQKRDINLEKAPPLHPQSNAFESLLSHWGIQ